MCYEERFFRRSVTKKAQKLDEVQRVVERAAPITPPARPMTTREPERREEVESEVETA